MQESSVAILGTASAIPSHTRNPTAQLLRIASSESILLDCGEGTQMQLLKYGLKSHSISTICISHLHGDHFLGLFGLLSTWSLLRRTKSVTIIAPVELQEVINIQKKLTYSEFSYPIKYNVPEDDHVLNVDGYSITAIELEHGITCYGYRISSNKGMPYNLKKERVEELPKQARVVLKQGKDYEDIDKVYKVSEFAVPALPPPTYAYITDTIPLDKVVEAVRGVDLLYHEATFLHNMKEFAKETGHSTAKQAGVVAKAAGVKRLVIGHYSNRYQDIDILQKKQRGNSLTLCWLRKER